MSIGRKLIAAFLLIGLFSAIVGAISESSKEQASSVMIINQGIEQVSEVVQKNSAMAEQSAAMSEKLYGQARLLADMAASFRYRERVELPDAPNPVRLLEMAG